MNDSIPVRDLEATLARAVQHHRAGQLAEAAALYLAILDVVPDHARTLYLLGRVRLRQFQSDEATQLLSRAAALEPSQSQYQQSLGDAFQRAERFADALSAYHCALTLAPGTPDITAKIDAVEFTLAHLSGTRAVPHRADLLAMALDDAKVEGLVMEFGVADGKSLGLLARRAGQTVYGFDSFKGLPEGWRAGFSTGAFEQPELPAGLPPNATLVVGKFEQSLERFAAENEGVVRFMHIDCDLYSSTRTVFDYLGNRLRPGSIVVFDEYLNYAGWREHEYRAFDEFTTQTNAAFEYIAYVPGGMQVAVRMGTRTG